MFRAIVQIVGDEHGENCNSQNHGIAQPMNGRRNGNIVRTDEVDASHPSTLSEAISSSARYCHKSSI
jgi:hypothetical protein